MSRSTVLLAFLLAAPVLGQVDTSWVRHFQYSPSYPSQYMSSYRSMTLDGSGNILLCCYGQYGASDMDMIVLKYRADGRLFWSARHDGGADEAAYAITTDRNNCVYAAGRLYSHPTAAMLVAKFDSMGSLLWTQKVYGDTTASYTNSYAVAVHDNGVYVAGTVCNRLSGQDLALARLDAATGAVSWLRTLSRSNSFGVAEAGFDVLTDGAGRVFVCGQVADALVANCYDAMVACYDGLGALLWERTYDNGGSSDYVRRLALSGTTVVAVGSTVSAGNANMLLIARSNLGGLLWWQQYDGTAHLADYGYDVDFAADGGVLACGLTTSATARSDVLLVKYSSAGAAQWARQYDRGMAHDVAYDLAVDAAGNIVLSGYSYESPASLLPDMAAVKYSSSGAFGWVFLFRPPGSEGANIASTVRCAGTDVLLGGAAHWGFPNYYDPTLLRLQDVPDVGVQTILAPTGTVSPGNPVTPRAVVANHSFQAATFRCQMRVSDGYLAEVPATLGPGLQTTVVFPDWTPQLPGYWAVRCSTVSDFDYNRANDARDTMVYVTGPANDVGVRAIGLGGSPIDPTSACVRSSRRAATSGTNRQSSRRLAGTTSAPARPISPRCCSLTATGAGSILRRGLFVCRPTAGTRWFSSRRGWPTEPGTSPPSARPRWSATVSRLTILSPSGSALPICPRESGSECRTFRQVRQAKSCQRGARSPATVRHSSRSKGTRPGRFSNSTLLAGAGHHSLTCRSVRVADQYRPGGRCAPTVTVCSMSSGATRPTTFSVTIRP